MIQNDDDATTAISPIHRRPSQRCDTVPLRCISSQVPKPSATKAAAVWAMMSGFQLYAVMR